MRRLMFAIASVAVFAFVPASALGRAGSQHHGRHHKRHHRHHAHIRRFGDVTSPGSPTTTPSPSQSAVTVASFTNGVLTITLNDGSTVSGAVTNDTEIECMAPDTSSTSGTMQRADDGPGDGGGDNGGSGDGGDHGGQGPGDDDNGNQNNCSSADLTQGAMVAGAELKITSSGNVWDKVELITSSTSSSSSGDDDGGSD